LKINKIRNSSYNFIKVFSLTSISTLIRILTGFLSVKFLSINLGPLGLALIGHFNNYSSIFMLIATGGITNGITKYIAEYGYTKKRKQLFIITSLCIVITLSLITSFILITFSKYFSRLIFNSNLYQNIIILFAITLVFNSLNYS
jgi:PST family polysaccharide transporter